MAKKLSISGFFFFINHSAQIYSLEKWQLNHTQIKNNNNHNSIHSLRIPSGEHTLHTEPFAKTKRN